MSNTNTRTAIVKGRDITPERIAPYLPANYEVLGTVGGGEAVVIRGIDNAGWTLDDYVIPRLASGLLFATEAPACFSPDLDGA